MRRLAFRTVLPIAMLAVSGLLLVLSESERSPSVPPSQPCNDVEVACWNLVTDGNYIPTMGEVALLALNAPAFLIAAIPIIIWEPVEDTWALYAIFSAAILAQWFLVGWEIDRRLVADLAVSLPIHSRSHRIIVWAGFVISALVALISLAANVLGGSGLSAELWLGFWFALIALMLWRRIKEWRKPVDDRVAALQLIH